MEQRDDLKWKLIKQEDVVNDEWLSLRREKYRMPDGSEFEPYYSYTRRNYVVIVSVDEDGNYILVRQFRQGVKKVTTEFPAGGIEKDEDPKEAAKRELLEETGYVADEMKFLLKAASNATMADNYAYLFKATGCKKVKGQDLDDTEFLNIETKTKDELIGLIKNESFEQAMHMLAFYLSEEK